MTDGRLIRSELDGKFPEVVVDRGILKDPAGIVLDLTNNTAFVADQGAHAIFLIDMEYHTNENQNVSFVYRIIDTVAAKGMRGRLWRAAKGKMNDAERRKAIADSIAMPMAEALMKEAVREVMIAGPSGLLSIGPQEIRPRFEASRRRLVWPNGAVGYCFSGEDPDGLRGPQFDLAWADEFAAWRHAKATLDVLKLGLRLGENPRLMITTTPRPIPALKALIAAPGTVTTRAGTAVMPLKPQGSSAVTCSPAASHVTPRQPGAAHGSPLPHCGCWFTQT